MRTVEMAGRPVPVIGQGTWKMGESAGSVGAEIGALKLGIDLGLTLIDTAELYADGGSEEIVGRAIAGQRDRVYVVSKVSPRNASRQGVPAACARSLRRLGIDAIDLYLLHWRGSTPLAETVEAFEALREAGHIRAWGVSNLDADELATLPPGCATDQVLYHPEARGIEWGLLPWCGEHRMPVMAYSPIGQAGSLLRSPTLRRVADAHDATPAQVAIAWGLRHAHVVSIPKAGTVGHVRENAAAASLTLTEADFAAIDAAHDPPRGPADLEML